MKEVYWLVLASNTNRPFFLLPHPGAQEDFIIMAAAVTNGWVAPLSSKKKQTIVSMHWSIDT